MSNKADEVEFLCTLERSKYYKDGWGIAVVHVEKEIRGTLSKNKWDLVTIKGTMPEMVPDCQYTVVATYLNDARWGEQYELKKIFRSVVFDDADSKKKFLLSLYTENQVNAMYAALKDPFEALKANNVQELVKIKGCGLHRAAEWIVKFNANISLGRIFTELPEYNLTNSIIERLMKKYGSPDVIIDNVKRNPYVLCEVDGIGWKTADRIALDGGMDPYCKERIGSYIYKTLRDAGESGRSWITADELLGNILDELGEETPDENITMALRENADKLWHEDDKIGLKYYYDLEQKIAAELHRIMTADNECWEDDWEDTIAHLEHAQGWNYTEEQRAGIQTALNNNVVVITGGAGSGKSSLVRGLLAVLKNYSYAQTALSGRAASRMSEITGVDGYTIHRLLGYPCMKPSGKNMFEYHDENPLSCKIVVLDEFSMVNSELFYALIRAIPSGGKLVCLGDPGQLEAIGSGNIAHDMIHSDDIPVVELTKIQRQAEASGIITESMKVRKGFQLIEKDWAGTDTRGELQDLDIVAYSDISNNSSKIIKAFQTEYDKTKDIMDVQVIVSTKQRGMACTYTLNNYIQSYVNPLESQVEVLINKNNSFYYLREGDKIINTSNNYNTTDEDGNNCPIYNGSIGIIKKISTSPRYMIIDFKGIGRVICEDEDRCWEGIELGYAITVHKSQGSEFNTVIFGVDFSGYSLLTRELVYTGITRAKKKLCLIAQNSALEYAIKTKAVSSKQTHLQQCIQDTFHVKARF